MTYHARYEQTELIDVQLVRYDQECSIMHMHINYDQVCPSVTRSDQFSQFMSGLMIYGMPNMNKA